MAEAKKKIESSNLRSWLKEGDLGKRLLIALIILLSLTLFLHFREVRVEMLQLDSNAKNYVVAQVDFEFPDKEGTVLLHQQAMQDIGRIYAVDVHQIKKVRLEIENQFLAGSGWRSALPNATYEDVHGVVEAVEKKLLNLRITNERTYRKLRSYQLSSDNFVASSGASIPEYYWNHLYRSLQQKYPTDVVRYMLPYFTEVRWKFFEDRGTEREIKEEIASVMPQKYQRIQAGSRIIDRGEKVTEEHLEKLRAMKLALGESRNLWQPLTILSSFLLALVYTLLGVFYFQIYHPKFFRSVSLLSLYATVVVITLAIAKITEYTLIYNSGSLIEFVRFPLIIPFASILICVLIRFEIALFTTILLCVILGFSLAVDHSHFITVNLVTGIVAILSSRRLRKRKEVFTVSMKVWLASLPIFLIYGFAQNVLWDSAIPYDAASAAAFIALTAILIVGILPLFESLFGVMTDITLMEYLDPSNELLRRLSIEAPGTYQHSLVVGSLSEAAAQAIGANGLFCRVASMYHDIGKLFNPHYFTENQMGGFNIHQLLTPLESTGVIIAHVTEGEQLARKNGLPQGFIDIIREHHGTTLVYYFYCKQVEQAGGDVDAVDESAFRYPGPTPRSKESAIIMIADTVEAASRSLEAVDEEGIRELVDRLVADKAEEGQFDSCRLTFEELQIVKKTVIKTLAVTRHLRVKYPEKRS